MDFRVEVFTTARPPWRPYAIVSVETAHNIKAALILCRDDAARAAIQSGIADYRKSIKA